MLRWQTRWLQYAEQAKALIQSGVSVVVFDLLGCGDSTKPRPADHAERMRIYSPHENYQDCIAVMHQFTSVRCCFSAAHPAQF